MKHSIQVGNQTLDNNRCLVVSEIGAMYENLKDMKKLIKVSKEAGADLVKLQTYRAETIALPGAEFIFEDGSRMSQFEFFSKYEISQENHRVLFEYAEEIGIPLFSTPSYYDDVDFLESLNVPAYKTGSDDLTNYPFLEYIAQKGKPMFVSTGMSTLGEVEQAVNTILETGNDQLVLLHCTTAYPPEKRYANLNIIKALATSFNLLTGYSDHVPGIFSSVLAASIGACVIEKHVTLDRALKRQDYEVSIEPKELQEMVDQIHSIPVLLGESVKKVYPQEEKWHQNARKSLVAAKNKKKGDILTREDIKIIRPGTGIHPQYLHMLVGKTLRVDISENEIIPKNAV
jgi:N,N'-diacetyllegionaminate synthase